MTSLIFGTDQLKNKKFLNNVFHIQYKKRYNFYMKKISITTKLFTIGTLLSFAIMTKNTPVVFAATDTDCSTDLDQADTIYQLTGNVAGNCTITANNITIDGQGLYTISGDVVADGQGSVGNSGYNVTIQNIEVTGEVYSRGALSVSGNGGSGGVVTLIDSTVGDVVNHGKVGDNSYTGGNGGNVFMTNSTSTSIDSSGAGGFINYGGSGGNIELESSFVSGSITTVGGGGRNYGGDGGDVSLIDSVTGGTVSVDGGSGYFNDGGNGGDVILVDSVTGNINAQMGSTYYGSNGLVGTLSISNSAPTLTVTPLAFDIEFGETFDEMFGTVSATDQRGTTTVDITDDIVVTGIVDSAAGEYEVVYEVEDEAFTVTFNSVSISTATNIVNETRTVTRLAAPVVEEQEDEPEENTSRRRSGSRVAPPPALLTPSTSDPASSLESIVLQYRDFLMLLKSQGVVFPNNVSQILNSLTTASVYVRDLDLGSTGDDVLKLQQFLIGQGYSIPAGATGYFGSQTQQALIQFQIAKNITPSVGYFGPKTRGVLSGF